MGILIAGIFSFCMLMNITNNPPKPFKTAHINQDSIYWELYKKRANIYLKRFPKSPITGTILKDCAMSIYDKYDLIIPVEFALAQAQMESGMGLKGRSPKNNPCNLGEYSDKTVLRYKTTEEGMLAYYKLIAKNYLDSGNRTLKDLFYKFVDKNGYKYAASPTYGARVGAQYKFIIKWINIELDK